MNDFAEYEAIAQTDPVVCSHRNVLKPHPLRLSWASITSHKESRRDGESGKRDAILFVFTDRGGGGGIERIPTTAKGAWASLFLPSPWYQRTLFLPYFHSSLFFSFVSFLGESEFLKVSKHEIVYPIFSYHYLMLSNYDV